MRYAILLLLLPVVLFGTGVFATSSSAETGAGWQRLGVRAGISATGDESVHQYELFTVYQLPWGVGSPSGWRLTTKINGAAGALHSSDNDGFIGSAGPGVGIEYGTIPLELDAGISVAFLSQDHFGGKDLNGVVQFISHAGLNWRIAGPVGIGYNFQHLSNAGLNGGSNPGLNMHMISLIWYLK